MKTPLRIAAVMSVLSFSVVARANTVGGVTVTETDGLGSSWLGTPTFATYPNPSPFAQTDDSDNAFVLQNWRASATTGHEPYGFGGIAQSFYLSTGGDLGSIQLGLANAPQDIGIQLYDLGPTSGYTPANSSSFTPYYNGGLANLLPTGLQFSYNASASGADNVAQITFSGLPIYLSANEEYAVAFELTSSAWTWFNRGVSNFLPNEKTMLYGYNDLFTVGNYEAEHARVLNMALAVTVVPEPSILALIGAGIAVGGLRICGRKR